MDKALLTIADAQTVVPVGRTKLYELINAGELTRVRIGRKPFITVASVEAYVDRLTRGGAA